MSTPADLLGALLGIPRMDAACLGQWSLFDPAESGETPAEIAYRHGAAIALCESCPALRECGEWASGLPPRDRPRGVVAGRLNDPKPRPRKKENS
ncbi:hypothetical protein [Mycolicibacterium brumae]|uniref:4Fe-4S Wbl-type domain-containing protein n=1 Tax=Mycolicibacterium brumae TaxID=85968 RepID=A0A2G5PBH2_9MYCO|nr:hypothetical protein [Mycolicibacterium brumae]MCV7191485.1 hypothetical protein [Mycolicibacterium brumae]PIB75709.1 hypothetical protein CQY22_008185 [Mycolicibacterium brumae]RWA16198.1 hypothetical protein MBRU_08810 [Mycolicibacterium brumae DSM 44177]UWW09408.1 hypothetical protein L2Z93_002505 [Mycolicibacterium brumae]